MEIPAHEKTPIAERSTQGNDSLSERQCSCCRLRQGNKAWQVLLVVLGLAYVILVTREVHKTKHDVYKINHLLYHIEKRISHSPNVWNPRVRVKQKSGTATANQGYRDLVRQKRSKLPANFLPVDVIPGPYNPQRGEVDNPRLNPLRSRSFSTQDGTLHSSLTRNRTHQSSLIELAVPTMPSATFSPPTISAPTSTTTSGGSEPGSEGAGRAGSTFVRWGKPSCPQNAVVIYTGYAAAAYPVAGFGGSTELECLPAAPQWNVNASSAPLSKTLISVVKFSLGSHRGVFADNAENSVVVCTVCFTPRTPVLMIPGQIDCPSSWNQEYYGYLMSTPGIFSQFYFSSKNYCVDVNPDFYLGHDDSLGLKLTFLQAGHCFQDKEPCRDYRIGKRMSCTVCSKVTSRRFGRR